MKLQGFMSFSYFLPNRVGPGEVNSPKAPRPEGCRSGLQNSQVHVFNQNVLLEIALWRGLGGSAS